MPDIKWFNEKKEEIPNEGRVRYVTDRGYTSLFIDNAELDDEGLYTCVASNPSGEVSATVEVLVDEPAPDELPTSPPPPAVAKETEAPVVVETVEKVFKEPDGEMQFTINLEEATLLRSTPSPTEQAEVQAPAQVSPKPKQKEVPKPAPQKVCTVRNNVRHSPSCNL